MEEGQRWQSDLNTVCTCTSGEVTCQADIKGKRAFLGRGVRSFFPLSSVLRRNGIMEGTHNTLLPLSFAKRTEEPTVFLPLAQNGQKQKGFG